MKLSEILNEAELIELARASETALGRAIEKLAQEEAAEVWKQIETNPKTDTESVKEDFRYKLGLRAGLKRMLDWKAESLEILKKGGTR